MLEISRYDLRAAKSLSNEPDDGMLQIAAYHAQQAVEKALKYCFSILGVKTPKTHDIRALLSELSGNPAFMSNMDEGLLERLELRADTLTLCEAKTRYPGDYMVERKTLLALIALTEEVIEACAIFAPTALREEVPTHDSHRASTLDLFNREK